MTSTENHSDFAARQTKVLAVMDVVESVRLMEEDEDGFVRRWQALVAYVEQLLPACGGRLVKSLGDGLMLEFSDAAGCVNTAFAIQKFSADANAVAGAQQIQLRMGAHLAEFVADKHDIYGSGVNLTARIAALAGPGELVITAELRDRLTAGLDADVEDLGECHLKHVSEPISVYRVGPPGPASILTPVRTSDPELRPTIAVIPFEARSNEPSHFAIGDLVADGIIAQLSRTAALRVISRLSTTPFRGRPGSTRELENCLAAKFALSGSYFASGDRLIVMAELTNTGTQEVIWADRLAGSIGDLLEPQSELLNAVASAVHKALVDCEVKQSLVQPLPRLDSCSLLLSGISLMHRSSVRDFERSRLALDALVERHNKIATTRAWLAKWHILRIIRGLSDAPARDTQLALEQTRRALDMEPENALTLAVEGHAYCQLLGDFDRAKDRLERAIDANPSEPMGWLFKSVLSSMWGSSAESVVEAKYSCELSPLDPLKYYFDLFLAAALLANNDHEQAIVYAQRSLRNNRSHAPTLRMLLTAQVEAGLLDHARQTLDRLLNETPGLTISSYLAIGSAGSATRQRCAVALRALGVPE